MIPAQTYEAMPMTTTQIKKIPAAELRIGMFVHDLNGDWMSHPFFRRRFSITSHDEVRKIIDAGIKEVYIDTSMGMNARYAPTKEEIHANIERELIELASEKTESNIRTSLSDELFLATKIKHDAMQQVCLVMQDARLGRVIDIERVEPVVQDIAESVFRNPGALTCMLRIKEKDSYTFLHSVSVSALLIAFCKSLGMDSENILQAGIGGLLHDIGKSKVDNAILNKCGTLTVDEFDIMRDHARHGHEILLNVADIGPIPLDIALHHHERHDGRGYPESLPGHEISTLAQMAAIVDVYDAITADRCYHKGIPAADALRRIYEWSQYHFNPELVQAFIRCIGIYPVGTLVLLESGRLGVVTEAHANNLLTPTINVFFNTNKKTYIKPQAIDLSKPLGAGGGDRIVTHVSAEKWNVDPMRFLALH